MRTLFILHDQMTADRLEQQHLLCLAMLNFDFDVQVVMQGSVWTQISASPKYQQAWRALLLYGVEEFLWLNGSQLPDPDWPVRRIDQIEFQKLLSSTDWVS